MSGAMPRQTLLTPGQEARVGLRVVLAVLGLMAIGIGALFALPSLVMVCFLAGASDGTPLSVTEARRVVAEQSEVLARALALSRRTPLPQSDDVACRSVASDLGALDMRFERSEDGPWVIIVWSRGGIPETYETQLTWVPEATAGRVRAGRLRLGETFEYVDRGWWRVFW